MSGFLELRYSRNALKTFQKEILSQKIGGLFFSMSFVDLKKETIAVVDTAEYIQISAIEHMSFGEAAHLIISVMEKMFETENHYFYIGEYKVAPKYIMYDVRRSDVAMIYAPFTYKNRESIAEDA